ADTARSVARERARTRLAADLPIADRGCTSRCRLCESATSSGLERGAGLRQTWAGLLRHGVARVPHRPAVVHEESTEPADQRQAGRVAATGGGPRSGAANAHR